MTVLVVGSVAFDDIETPHGRVEKTVGGAATYFALAASLFSPVKLVGVVGDDFHPAHESVFHGRPIDLAGLERVPGKTFFWAGRYGDDLNQRTTLATELNVFAAFQPKLPENYQACPFVFLANIDPTLQRSVLRQVSRRPRLVALDTMNYWIERTPAELAETLRHTDVLIVNDEEARQLSGCSNLMRAASRITSMGPRALVIKRGEHGATLINNGSVFSVPGYPLEEVRDPTGAGDSFAGGFMGSLATTGRIGMPALRRAMVYGSVLGSFAVERFGLERLRSLTPSEVGERARRFRALTYFSL
ncbi:MAG TPA: PfkB family carbohydrate kinase [Candidatus Acidoferrales bacterium]|nr:PfkB family carbohydrate kinase [Candidatus Acidoferrales bacterium]